MAVTIDAFADHRPDFLHSIRNILYLLRLKMNNMKKQLSFPVIFFLFLLNGITAQTPGESRMMTDPSVSSDHIVFVYSNDLWTARLDGSDVIGLTSNEGNEFAPHFSPDGMTIAFTGQYDGNMDVFTIPAEGGVPTRLTWHPEGDFARGYTPNGNRCPSLPSVNHSPEPFRNSSWFPFRVVSPGS